MLNFDKTMKELNRYNFSYHHNILTGHIKHKVDWVLPTGIVNTMAFKKASSYMFGFNELGIHFFPIKGDWYIADHLFIPWDDISSFSMEKGLIEYEMRVKTKDMHIIMKIHKAVWNNQWIKDNHEYLARHHYYYGIDRRTL